MWLLYELVWTASVSRLAVPSRSVAHRAKMDDITRAMATLRVDSATEYRIRYYFQYIWMRHKDFGVDRFIR